VALVETALIGEAVGHGTRTLRHLTLPCRSTNLPFNPFTYTTALPGQHHQHPQDFLSPGLPQAYLIIAISDQHQHHSNMEQDHIRVTPQKAGLCSTCDKMLNPQSEPEPYLNHVRKQTLKEFQEAVCQKCPICSLIWTLTDEHPLAWSQMSHESWTPRRYLYVGQTLIYQILRPYHG
jgi:hypothetical protein